MTRRHDILSLVCIALLALCTSSCQKAKPADMVNFELIYTTDIHGKMLDTDFLNPGHHDAVSLANVMSYVEMARTDLSHEVLLLDNGDLLQGDPSMYYYNVEAIRDEHLAVRVCNYIGYDAINMGNHDFEAGEGIYYDHFAKQTQATILAANAIDTRTGQPMFQPYTIIERSGVRIAVLGITHSGSSHWLSKSMYPHIEFQPMAQAVSQWVPRIIDSENPDAIFLMIHAGNETETYTDPQTGVTFCDDLHEVMKATDQVDLVLIGHNHKWGISHIPDAAGDSILVVQPKSHAEQFATIRFTVDVSKPLHQRVTFEDVHLQETWRLAPHADFCRTFAGAVDSVNRYLDTPLGKLDVNLDGKATLVGQSNLMDLIHAVQLDKTGADISVASAVNSFDDIPRGDISMRQLFELYKYENQIDKVWMTGEEVKRFLEYGYGRQFTHMQKASDHLLNYVLDPATGEVLIGAFGPELVTPQYNFTSAAGINYTVDVSQPAGSRVQILSMADGSPFSLGHRYIVAMNSFQAAGGGGFLTRGLGWTPADMRYHAVTESTKDMRYYIGQYIRRTGTVRCQPHGTWHVIPEAWWKANSERDVELLVPYLKH